MANGYTPLSSSHEYRKGDQTQRLLAEFFKGRGWYVLPAYDYSARDTKAPRMQGQNESFVVPDLDICKQGTRRWAEAKYKEHAVFYRKTRQLKHGLALRHFNHYKQVAKHSGDEVWLFVHEGCTGKVLARRIVELEPHGQVWASDTMDRGGTIFFPRTEFQRLAEIEHPIASVEVGPIRKAVEAMLARGANLSYDHRTGALTASRGVLTRNEEALLYRHKEVILTIIVALELLPWWGEL